MKFTWKVRKNDGYRCETLRAGTIKVAWYKHLPYKDDFIYMMEFDLPTLGDKWFKFNDIEKAKAQAERMVMSWFTMAEIDPEELKEFNKVHREEIK